MDWGGDFKQQITSTSVNQDLSHHTVLGVPIEQNIISTLSKTKS